MRLEGSCACGAVRFRLQSAEPVPFQRCYCSICRKLGGGGGYLINIGGEASTLEVDGGAAVQVFHANVERDGRAVRSKHGRHFCRECGAHLWAAHADWPELVHPVAGAIDSELPRPPEHRHMMVGSKASWVTVEGTGQDSAFDAYPDCSLAEWHAARGL
ncbi:MAG: GFA family protein [Myxococcales bacterium]|nr:GFA family protein [Myxococcales bacterium]